MAIISHPNESKHIAELVKAYSDAQQKLIKIVGQKHARKNNTDYERRILTQTNATLRELVSDTKVWTNSNIPRSYKKGVNKAMKAFNELGVDVKGYEAFEKIHQKQIDILVRNTNDDLNSANNFIGRNIRDSVRQISIETIKEARLTGRSVGQIRRDLIDNFIDNNITSMETKNGRRINLDSYASTVARSTTREAENTAVIEHIKANGTNLVKMSSHLTTCPICAPLQGRVYSIDGNSTDYPSLDLAYTGDHANIHPNCRHFLAPYMPDKDKNSAETKRFSNRSFNIDPRSQAQINNYNHEQRRNRERNADKRQWERYKIVMPNETPKTLSGFRKSKRANSKKYQELDSRYRSIRLTQN